MKRHQFICAILTLPILIQACAGPTVEDAQDAKLAERDQYFQLEPQFAALVEQHDILTAGAAVIANGEIVWTGYFGEQASGVPASALTQFNVGSVTKTVAAEVILRLADAGELTLDEAMSAEWIDPDIKDDSRHEALTPRIALTHTTGFPNWRFFTDDGKLKFQTDPGSAFSYSGEGFEYLATFAEKRTGRDFETLIKTYVFDPIGISNTAYSIDESNFENIAQTRDRDGAFPGHYCYPDNGYCRSPGSSTPADDLVITVEEYAAFLISVMDSDGYGDSITVDRNTVQSTKGVHAIVDCKKVDAAQCPIRQGYGLGWEVLDYGDSKYLAHGGSDWHELAIAYFNASSRDGIVIFLNAPSINALKAMPDAISILDSDSPFVGQYRRWLAQADSSE